MKFALQTANGVNYLTAINGGGIGGPNDATCPIHTDAAAAGQWETFTFQVDDTATPPTVRLLTSTGNYVTAVNGGGVGGPNTQPVHTDAKTVGDWEQFSLPPSTQPQPVLSQAYTFSLNKFTCNKMRSNNFLGTERDTDYASLSIIVNNGAPQTQTQSMGNVDSNSTYSTNLRIPSIQVADTDNVIIQYHIINASGGQAAATSILEQASERIGSAAVQTRLGCRRPPWRSYRGCFGDGGAPPDRKRSRRTCRMAHE